MVLFPNAKINFGLDILKRLPNGYHEISTLFLPTKWCDILEILPLGDDESTRLIVTGRNVDCPPEKNLVMKAYRAISDEIPIPPVEIRLHKVIPDGAGLGGGSADASYTLIGLNELFSLNLSKDKLSAIASTIGADCSYFIYGGAMMASGIGTQLSPSDFRFPPVIKSLAIVKPPVSMSTKEAYAGVVPAIPQTELSERIKLPVSDWQTNIINDFEQSVFSRLPIIREIKEKLISMGALYSSMSGSGTSVYALYGDDIMAENLIKEFPDCDIHVETL